jgi:hypothetical protein
MIRHHYVPHVRRTYEIVGRNYRSEEYTTCRSAIWALFDDGKIMQYAQMSLRVYFHVDHIPCAIVKTYTLMEYAYKHPEIYRVLAECYAMANKKAYDRFVIDWAKEGF